MKIFKVKPDLSYQQFLPKDESIWATDRLTLDCERKGEPWAAPDVYVFNPKLKRSDISSLCPGGFVINERTFRAAQTCLELSSELLKVQSGSETLYLVNVVECVNCLDPETTVAKRDAQGRLTSSLPAKYGFIRNRLPGCCLFKIPETSRAEVFALTDVFDPDEDFMEVCASNSITGASFELVWEDEP